MRRYLSNEERAVLLADPRYQAIREAESRMMAALRAADDAAALAISECETAIGQKQPERLFTYARSVVAMSDSDLFERLRPRGDKMRVAHVVRGKRGPDMEVEIEDITNYFISASGSDYRLWNGEQCCARVRAKSDLYYIHPDDLARIKSGELKGWKQKDWGSS